MHHVDIQYDTYNDDTVVETFYFNITKLEAIELELQFEGGLEGHINRITEAQSAPEAFALFKDIVLSAYGRKTPDGRGFYKRDPQTGNYLKYEFEASPALGELILGFIERPKEGAEFIEKCLPKKLIEEAKAGAAEQRGVETAPAATGVVLGTSAPVLEKKEPKKYEEYTREELLAMSQPEFDALVGTDPMKMPPGAIQIAYIRKA